MTDGVMKRSKAVELIRIVLISDDQELCHRITYDLHPFDFNVISIPTEFDVTHAAFAGPPDLVVMDVLSACKLRQDQGSGSLFEQIGHMVPTIFLMENFDFESRIIAARIGARAVLTKPVETAVLVAQIDALLITRTQSPYRVLIVDDDELLGERFRLILVSAGMVAERVSRPLDALAALERLKPDLMLVDLYMPECSGAVLVKALRYDSAWQRLPIIYLSAETDRQIQMAAMASDADDFLSKPISDAQLVAVVNARAARARRRSLL